MANYVSYLYNQLSKMLDVDKCSHIPQKTGNFDKDAQGIVLQKIQSHDNPLEVQMYLTHVEVCRVKDCQTLAQLYKHCDDLRINFENGRFKFRCVTCPENLLAVLDNLIEIMFGKPAEEENETEENGRFTDGMWHQAQLVEVRSVFEIMLKIRARDSPDVERLTDCLDRLMEFNSRHLLPVDVNNLAERREGELLLVEHGNHWYRARLEDANVPSFFLADIGSTAARIPQDRVRIVVSKRLVETPFAVRDCMLHRVEPLNHAEHWTEETNEALTTMMRDGRLEVRGVRKVSYQNTGVHLVDMKTSRSGNLAEKLVKNGFANPF